MSRFIKKTLILAGALTLAGAFGCTNSSNTGPAENWVDIPGASRGLDGPSKLDASLQRLADGAGGARGLDAPPPPSPREIGYPMPGTTDVYEVAIETTPGIDINALTAAGASILMRAGNIIYAAVSAENLPQVAQVDGVLFVNPMPAPSIPKPPAGPSFSADSSDAPRDIASYTGDDRFDHPGLTGKGVLVGVIDTGIDWHHGDFRNPDGSTRIIALWDEFDTSWTDSKGTIGTKPPVEVEGKLLGTIYTADQINTALRTSPDQKPKILHTDSVGHGTACAGTAAGNGRGTGNNVPAGTYVGIAPEADLIIVNSHDPNDAGNPDNDGAWDNLAAQWIVSQAALRHEPVVINMSYGGPETAHDGSDPEEAAIEDVMHHGTLPGVVMCASASNDGRDVIHARNHFGPDVGMIMPHSAAITMTVRKETMLCAYFASIDDWQLVVTGQDNYLVGADHKPARLRLAKAPTVGVHPQTDGIAIPAPDSIGFGWHLHMRDGKDMVKVKLEPGLYKLGASGTSDNVSIGIVDFYLCGGDATFDFRGDHDMVVECPGTANDVITVGSYDFRNTWPTAEGTVADSLQLGELSDYSSAGYRTDGVVKPDITSPGQWTISSMAPGSGMAGDDPGKITSDGTHLAWAGTSASSPFTAGVIALMLQKNPNLTCNDVKKILRDTATTDKFTGSVPNREWGYGKINPVAAIAAVTAAPPHPAPPPALPVASFAGTFVGDGMTLQLIPAPDGSFTGFIQNPQFKCPVTAQLIAGQIQGAFTLQGQAFTFTASLNGDQLTLTTGSKSHTLTRQPAGGIFP